MKPFNSAGQSPFALFWQPAINQFHARNPRLLLWSALSGKEKDRNIGFPWLASEIRGTVPLRGGTKLPLARKNKATSGAPAQNYANKIHFSLNRFNDVFANSGLSDGRATRASIGRC